MRYEIRWTDVSLRQVEKLDKKEGERIGLVTPIMILFWALNLRTRP